MAPLAALQPASVRLEIDAASQCAVFWASGDLDESSVPAFRSCLHDAIARGCRDLIIDVGEVVSIVPTYVSMIVCGLRRFGNDRGRVVLTRCPPPVEALLRKLRIAEVAPVYADVPAARSAMFQIATHVFEPFREQSARLRSWLRCATAGHDLNVAEQEAIEAAASEAFANAVQHAAPTRDSTITVRVCLGSNLVIEVQDQGSGFEAKQYFAADPALLHTGARGLGIHVMRNLMQQVEFVAGSSGDEMPGTTVRLIQRLQAPPPRAAPWSRSAKAKPRLMPVR